MSEIDLAFYDGSRKFSWLSELSGLTIDQTNFAVSQAAAFIFAIWLRNGLHPDRTSTSARHLFSAISGLWMVYFCFGSQIIHVILLSFISYVAMNVCSPKYFHKIILSLAMGYLSYVHIMRQIYSYGSYILDITGPMMLITQKVTSLAFSLHDGLAKAEQDLTKEQKEHVVKKIPTPLEYVSYIYHFQTLMCGPLVFYNDYIHFIEGSELYQISKHNGVHANGNGHLKVKHEPSSLVPVIVKLLISLLFLYLVLKLVPLYPIEILKDDNFLQNASTSMKFFTIIIITSLARYKYYHAWLLADAICNASGLGFNGYDKNGKPKWDLISNVDILNVEFSLNFREILQNWNKGTMIWLRRIAYERTPYLKTWATFCLSAIWHGFYPGYYFSFISAALVTVASRAVRRSIRPYFQTSSMMARIYDIITIIFTRILLAYLIFPFVLLELKSSFQLYVSLKFSLHLVFLLCVLLLPKILPPPPKVRET